MTKHQTLEQWLADEEQKQEARNSESNKEELITQINHLNLELAQEKRVSQILAENWKKTEKELEKEKEWVTVLTNYRNKEKNDKLVNILTILLLSLSATSFTIYFFKQKAVEEKKQITNF